MNPEQILEHLKKLTATLSPRQLATMAATFTVVVGLIVGAAYWVNAPSYSLLYSDLDPESANQVVTRLKNAKIQYVLDDGGRAVRVPADKLDELRLEMAS
ncbi:MAG TPA: hypothetical protein VNT81_09645, partial [Vicinamibacterales bacterium]|nr:hypothetical protein [Vicinamibacterales bacterium]